MMSDLSDLNKILFDQLNRLNNDGLSGDALSDEVSRSGAVVSLSSQVVGSARTVLDAAKLQAEYTGKSAFKSLPGVVGGDGGG